MRPRTLEVVERTRSPTWKTSLALHMMMCLSGIAITIFFPVVWAMIYSRVVLATTNWMVVRALMKPPIWTFLKELLQVYALGSAHVHTLVSNGVALLSAHTNADTARPGVSDALADALGLVDLDPLVPMREGLDKIVTFVPHAQAESILDALAAAGAGRIGDYDRCGYLLEGMGTFRPLAGANPTIGQVGRVEQVPETRLEMVLPRERRDAVVAALRASHPYEEPAFDVIELAEVDARRGLGRVGHLPEPETLEDLVVRVAAAVPASAGGVQASGDPDRVVQRIAVCGGSGDSLLDAAGRASADAFVTADLRHHPASEALEAGGPALVNLSHWSSEWPWLPLVADLLRSDLADDGEALEMRVSETCTDPWTMHAESLSRDMLEDED